MNKKKLLGFFRVILVNLSIFSALCLLVEIVFILYVKSYFIQSVFQLSPFLRSFIKFHITDIIQYKTECSRFDKELLYTLKPGECDFNIADSNTSIKINSLGVRDDEESLAKPEIVILGDSFTMGWGVSDRNHFSALLEASLNLKVLNAGISSYGTIRELNLLKRIDTSNMKYLIIQYCPNDAEENNSFLLNGKLSTSSEFQYSNLVDLEKSKDSYYPGKYLTELIKVFIQDYLAKFEYNKLKKKMKKIEFAYNQNAKIFETGQIETQNSINFADQSILYLQGFAFEPKTNFAIKKIGIFINKKEVPARITYNITRKDLVNKIGNGALSKVGWQAAVILPTTENLDMSMEAQIQDSEGRQYFLPYEKKNEIFLSNHKFKSSEAFMNILNKLLPELAGTKILITSLDDYETTNDNFLNEIEVLKKSKNYEKIGKNISVINIQDSLTKQNFFYVDDHINVSGHKIVADKLFKKIKEIP